MPETQHESPSSISLPWRCLLLGLRVPASRLAPRQSGRRWLAIVRSAGQLGVRIKLRACLIRQTLGPPPDLAFVSWWSREGESILSRVSACRNCAKLMGSLNDKSARSCPHFYINYPAELPVWRSWLSLVGTSTTSCRNRSRPGQVL